MAAVDEFDLVEMSPDGGASAVRSARRGHTHPWGWLLAALALIGVGAANTDAIPAMVGGGEGVDIGLLGLDIREVPDVRWESPLMYAYLVTNDGDVTVAMEYGSDVPSAVGIDLATGAERWRYPVPNGTCQWSDRGICVEEAATPEATIIMIDLDDGTRVAEPHPGAVGAITVPGGIVVVEATDDQAEEIVLIEPDGTERWRITAEAADVSSEGAWVEMQVTADSVIMAMSGTEIELATGSVTTAYRWSLSEDIWIEATDTGDALVTTPEGSFTLVQDETWLSWDDDFGGPIALRQDAGTGLMADRRADGTQLWRIATTDCYATARILGTVVTQCWGSDGERLHAIDQLTGQTRWELERATVVGASRHVLLVANNTDRILHAVDPIRGDVLWSIPIPSILSGRVTEIPGGVLVPTDTTLVRLAWE